MADEADDVLDLDPELEIEEGADGDVTGDEAEEEVFSFGDEGAAPVLEGESSVIRDLRRANRELAKKLSAHERQTRVQQIEIGPKPTLASCDYDEERFETDLTTWNATVAKAEAAKHAEIERNEAERRTWDGIKTAYERDKSTLKVGDYAAAEEEVFASLPEQHQALLMKSGKGAQLVVALSRSPEKLQALSEMNLADAAMEIGELRGKLQVTKQAIQPERRVSGNTGTGGGFTDKRLAQLKAKAQQTGVYDEYFAAKRAAGV